MKVVVIGASGKTGNRVVQELVKRGHTVLAIARDLGRVPSLSGVQAKQDDLSDVNRLAEILAGSDVVVSAYAPPLDDTDALVGVTDREIEAVNRSGAKRLIVVGGAGGLEVAPGVSLIDSGHLPAEWLPIARSHVRALEQLKASEIDWTYFAPAAYFGPGARTGKFRLGKDQLVSDAEGNSRISMEDYAIALVDEIENPQQRRQRFTIGY